jgi:tetratricopeptide repeat protein
MILVYAGRRPGADFPDENLDFVAEQVERLIVGLNPRLVIGSAAAGGDLLAIEAATSAKVREVRVLIAGDRESFRNGSVSDKGRDWEIRFDTQLRLDGVHVEEVALVDGDGDATYRAVTERISAVAEAELEDGEELVVLAIWKERDGGVDHTKELIAHHEARNRLVLRIDPARTYEDSEAAFIAMPFGTKPYPERGWKHYEADLSYSRLMTPALIDGGYRPVRADTDALLEVIDHTMLRHLNRAKLVLADLAMLNANVMWEVGLRHAWRRAGTVLIAPRWVTSPFDVARIPLHHYDRTARNIKDADAVAAIKHLRRVLADVGRQDVDSPVFANLPGDFPDVELPTAPHAAESAAGELLAEISLAVDLRRKDRILTAAQRARDADDLEESTRSALLEQCGLALNSLGEHDAARELLEPLAAADSGYERRHLQQECAHAEVRSDEDKWLGAAQTRLQNLIRLKGGDSEAYGLLGSVHKRRVADRLRRGESPDQDSLDHAIKHYLTGFTTDPGDFYPGINAIALLRLRGQRFRPNATDLARARELVPVVRFAVTRFGDDVKEDGWALLTLAELALHQQLLGERVQETPAELYIQAAPLSDQQRKSSGRQLQLLRDAGDPDEVLDPLLKRLR